MTRESVLESDHGTAGATGDVLSVSHLSVQFCNDDGVANAVDDVSFHLGRGEVLGVVGESGSGKSVTFLSILGLIPRPPGEVTSGSAVIASGEDLFDLDARALRKVRGKRISMIFQDPLTSLNPVFTVGRQLEEALRLHNSGLEGKEAQKRAVALLDLVGIPDPMQRHRQYPHQFSGGMRQRVMIAMAIANDPEILIADEPTTALDATVQAQIMEVLNSARRRTGASMVLITHDLGVVAQQVDRVLVMYAGRIVEEAPVEALYLEPAHPYTAGLLACLPPAHDDVEKLQSIEGQPPNMMDPPSGCRFHPRCSLMKGRERCTRESPALREVGLSRRVACHFAEELLSAPAATGVSTPTTRSDRP